MTLKEEYDISSPVRHFLLGTQSVNVWGILFVSADEGVPRGIMSKMMWNDEECSPESGSRSIGGRRLELHPFIAAGRAARLSLREKFFARTSLEWGETSLWIDSQRDFERSAAKNLTGSDRARESRPLNWRRNAILNPILLRRARRGCCIR